MQGRRRLLPKMLYLRSVLWLERKPALLRAIDWPRLKRITTLV